MKVIKRDGRKVDFDKQKIINAIEKAMERTDIGVNHDIALSITNKIFHSIEDKKKVTVEEIQDMVEDKLMSSSRKDVAKEFITYRNERTKVRNKDTKLYNEARKILNCENVDNTNANIDQYSFSGKENRIGANFIQQFATDELLTDRVRKAKEQHYIYLHDYDKYSIGEHNCLFADIARLLKNGFHTRNGDVRPANSVSTAFQLIAVIFQCQSQVQFGGVASAHIDFDIAPYVKLSFAKHLRDGLEWVENITNIEVPKSVSVTDKSWEIKYPKAFKYATKMTYREGLQGAQAFYHNLNTLESRAGSQVPFTSINLGRDTSREGQLVSEWIFKASIDGIGKLHQTSIFPIAIFQHKKGVNDKEGTPNYYLKELAIKSMCKRIYPNWVNCDFSQHQEDINDIDTYKCTMGCRTQLGFDRHGMGYKQVGRGNICPTTMILPKLGIEYGICQGKRDEPDLKGFWKAFDEVLDITRESLLNRYAYISGQSPKSAPFMYENGTIADSDKCTNNVEPAMKHGTLAFGFIGLAEMCEALFGTNFVHDKKVYDFALKVVTHIYDYTKECSEKYNLNFSNYFTPAEGLCEKAETYLKDEYGVIPNITDKKYLTNSTHVPVWEEMSFEKKLELEAPFTKYGLGGCITYGELNSDLSKNLKGVEDIINRAMELDIPYLALNFPIDTCQECGFQGKIEEKCPNCNSDNILRIARVTGYLSTDVSHFNEGKQAEVKDRVTHDYSVDFGGDAE